MFGQMVSLTTTKMSALHGSVSYRIITKSYVYDNGFFLLFFHCLSCYKTTRISLVTCLAVSIIFRPNLYNYTKSQVQYFVKFYELWNAVLRIFEAFKLCKGRSGCLYFRHGRCYCPVFQCIPIPIRQFSPH